MNALRIGWIAVRELFYERVFYILLCFALVSMGLSLMLGQLTYAEQSKLTLDFMLAGIQLSMILFSVFMGISLFQRELTLGSVSMVLSKPISRGTFLIGKYLGQIAVQALVSLLMAGITMLLCSRFDAVSNMAIFQTVLLIIFEVCVLTAITYFFAVNAGAITTAIVTLLVFGLGHMGDSITNNIQNVTTAQLTWRAVRAVFPDLEVFNMKALASYGLTLGAPEMGWAAMYAAVCTVCFLIAAVLCFNRKDIFT